MYLIQLLLPLFNNEGKPFPKKDFEEVGKTLTETFGGMTSYIRAPAKGFWKDDENETVKDDIILFEVMDKNVNLPWWKEYKGQLQNKFQQDEIIIRSTKINLL